METVATPHDELFESERRIAKRADELTRKLGTDRGQALEHWRQAEAEVWGMVYTLPTKRRSPGDRPMEFTPVD